MKRLVWLLAPLLLFSGCTAGREIQNMEMVRVVGIDEAEDGTLMLTIGSQIPSSGSGEENVSFNSKAMAIPCTTLAEGFSAAQTEADDWLFLGHVSMVLLGEAAAKGKIVDYLDFFVRDSDFRFDLPLVVVRGSTAQETIERGSTKETHVADRVQSLLDQASKASFSGKVVLSQAVSMTEDPYAALYLPYLTGEPTKDSQGEDLLRLQLDGYCVFKAGSLAEFLMPEESRALNLLQGNFSTGLLVVETETGPAAFTVVKGGAKLKPEGEGMLVEIKAEAEIAESGGSINSYDERSLAQAEEALETVLRRQVRQIAGHLQDIEVDCTGFGRALYRKRPREMTGADAWREQFPGMPFTVVANVKIKRSRAVNKPLQQKGT